MRTIRRPRLSATLVLALLTAVVGGVAACVEVVPDATPTPTPGDDASETASATPTPTATLAPGPAPLTDAAVIALLDRAVCWQADPALAATCLPPNDSARLTIAEIGRSGDPRFVSPLIDMLWLDVGWRRPVADALFALTGRRFEEPGQWYAWAETEWQPPTAEALPDGYAQWKARLLSITAAGGPTSDDEPSPAAPAFSDLIDGSALVGRPDLLVWTGVQPNEVPPLNDPATVHRVEERYLAPSDVVYGVVLDGEARAYPRRIVAWHGIVNDTIGDRPVAIVHCLPCGSAIAYDRRAPGQDQETTRFGNAGLAFQSRTLIFDEASLTLWDAFSGYAVSGPRLGPDVRQPQLALETFPLLTTTWEAWSKRHPHTTVLDLDTGFVRDYEAGAALRDDLASPAPLLPVGPLDERLPAKEPVIGTGVFGLTRAYPVALIERQGIVHDTIGGPPVVLISEGPGAGVAVYSAEDLIIERLEGSGDDLRAVDSEGERWFINPRALVSTIDGREHPRLASWQGYWFAWSTVHSAAPVTPPTSVYAE